jgi:hypothetical protein
VKRLWLGALGAEKFFALGAIWRFGAALNFTVRQRGGVLCHGRTSAQVSSQ